MASPTNLATMAFGKAQSLDGIADGAAGTIVTSDGDGTVSLLGQGTSGQHLTSAGAGAPPTWATPTPTPYGTLISAQTASASATIDFTSVSGYDIYTLVLDRVVPATDDTVLQVQISTSGVFKVGASDYDISTITQNSGGTADNTNTQGATHMDLSGSVANKVGSAAGEHISGSASFYGLSSAAVFSSLRSEMVGINASGQVVVIANAGLFNTAEVNDGIRLLFSSGNIASGTFALYGSNV